MERLRPRARLLAPAVALAIVGALFIAKYGARVTPAAAGLAVSWAVLFVGVLLMASRRDRWPAWGLGWGWATVVFAAFALALFSPEANRVARLPALAVWLERLTTGHFPYGAPIRPSGFPGLYALVLPFWATASLRLLPVVGIAVFVVATRPRAAAPMLGLLGLALLPSVWYEVAVHSELFFNVALALASLWVFERARHGNGAALAAAAVLAGLLLSTRLVVGVVYAVWGAYAFRSAWACGAAFAGIAVTVWVATWVPFALWDPVRFAALGPFSIQGLYVPTEAMIGATIGALALGWSAPDLASVVSRIGWLLFALVILSFGITVAELGFETALYDGFDLAYFVLPTPFFLAALGQGDRIVPASPASRS